MERYYHLFANGDDARNFITSEDDFRAAFNRIAICSHLSGGTVLSASVEDSHPHVLLRGTPQQCEHFKYLYERISLKYIVSMRGSSDNVNLHCELYEITDPQYLKNVAAYTIVQATKDGKDVMPYDYRYGTGAIYFRKPWTILPWKVSIDGKVLEERSISSLTEREKRHYFPRSVVLPGDWIVCNGFILPTNYVDIKGFEGIFGTANCFRVFLSNSKSRDEIIRNQMSTTRGVVIEDLEARRLCSEACMQLFGRQTTRHITADQRLHLAQHLRTTYHLSFRQISTLTKLPEAELRKYVR